MKKLMVVIASIALMGCGAATKMNPGANGKKSPSRSGGAGNQCKTKDDKSLDQQKSTQNSTATIKQVNQQAIYKNCEGKEINKKLEKIKEKSKATLQFKNTSKTQKTTLKLVTTNRTTCESTIHTIKKGTVKFELPVSAEKTDKEHLLLDESRENYIDYEISECTDAKSNKECTGSQVIEQGTAVLTVKISESDDKSAPKEITACRKRQKN